MITVVNISNQIYICNPYKSLENIRNMIKMYDEKKPDIILISSNPFTGSSFKNIIYNPILTENINGAIQNLSEYSKKIYSYIIFIQSVLENNKIIQKAFMLYKGKIHSYNIKKNDFINFSIKNNNIILLYNVDDNKKVKFFNKMSDSKKNIILISSNYKIKAGKLNKIISIYKDISKEFKSELYCSNGSIGDSTSPYIYNSFIGYFNNGECLHFESSLYKELSMIYDGNQIYKNNKSKENIDISKYNDKTPYIYMEEKQYLLEIFDLQIASLYYRLKNTNIKNVVLGISGGLDSTIALLVSYMAIKKLGLDGKNILGITMPGLGTSSTTYNNAIKILNELKCNFKEISIKESILKHFKDIDHNIENKDTTYENAQSRERTQILLDIANKINGLVVGTGDLSESALGFCTFAGDHIANFNVNICLTKTMIRKLLLYIIEENIFENSNETLKNILNTPISPELIKNNEDSISQKTEDILGPYILHDFFLYYLINENYTPKQIYNKSCELFESEYSKEFIKQKLKLFLKKFFLSQFKRNCAPECSIITNFNLSDNKLSFPSDYYPDIFIDNL